MVELYRYKNVIVYSNEDTDATNEIDGIYTGLQWQCVELARRYLITQHRLTFPSVPNAYDIFDLTHFLSIDTSEKVPITAYKNGSNVKPTIGSLLIWAKTYNNEKTGHVAVVTAIYPHSIQIMEQNSPQPMRCIMYSHTKGYFLEEKDLLGWVTTKFF
jgi:glutathionylspermidine amidase/synthetase